jgi:hypothetical protein
MNGLNQVNHRWSRTRQSDGRHAEAFFFTSHREAVWRVEAAEVSAHDRLTSFCTIQHARHCYAKRRKRPWPGINVVSAKRSDGCKRENCLAMVWTHRKFIRPRALKSNQLKCTMSTSASASVDDREKLIV